MYQSLMKSTEKIAAIGGSRLEASDAVFIIKKYRSTHWGKYVTYTSNRSVWYEYDSLIVITGLQTLKLTWTANNGRLAHDKIVDEVKAGRIKSMVSLYSEMNKHANRYGMPIALISTNLEYYND